MFSVFGFLVAILGWVLIFYALLRNQKEAKESPLVDDTNFGPRIGAIVETTLHPDHAAVWLVECSKADAEIVAYRELEGTPLYLKRVFPAIGQDSSEQYGIREDDGRAT